MFNKLLLLSAVMVSQSCFASLEHIKAFDDEVRRICSHKFTLRKTCLPTTDCLSLADESYQDYMNSVFLIMAQDLPTVTALTFDETKKRLDVRKVKLSSSEFGVPKPFWPLAEVEGDVYDYINVSDGTVHRLGLIKGNGQAQYQSQGTWESLKIWLESLE